MCDDGNSYIPFESRSYFSTVNDWVFYPTGDWVPSFEGIRAALRLLAEQGDGIDVTPAVRTATVRYDVNGTAGLNPWTAVGTLTSNEGDSNPEDINLTSVVSGEFWMQPGIGIRKSAGGAAVGQGQAGVQYNLPTERLVLLGGPVNLDTVTTPVGNAWAELWATEWMSFYELEQISVPYDIYDASGYEFEFVLQSVKTDPTQEAPSADAILTTTSAPASGVATASSFTTASTNKAQLCRVVFRARASGAVEGTARAWFAVAGQYA